MRNKYGVAIYRNNSYDVNGYAHLRFRFLWLNAGYRTAELFEVSWQTDNHNPGEREYWYGFTVKVSLQHADELAVANRLAQRLFEADALTPEKVLEFVASKRDVVRVTYDSRITEYVENSEVCPVEWPAWKDSANTFHVVAKDEAHAQDVLEARLRDRENSWYLTAQKVEDWVADGRPVAQLYGYQGPHVYSDEEAVALPGW